MVTFLGQKINIKLLAKSVKNAIDIHTMLQQVYANETLCSG
jgi:NRPS condensation-like uncharacterized protein